MAIGIRIDVRPFLADCGDDEPGYYYFVASAVRIRDGQQLYQSPGRRDRSRAESDARQWCERHHYSVTR